MANSQVAMAPVSPISAICRTLHCAGPRAPGSLARSSEAVERQAVAMTGSSSTIATRRRRSVCLRQRKDSTERSAACRRRPTCTVVSIPTLPKKCVLTDEFLPHCQGARRQAPGRMGRAGTGSLGIRLTEWGSKSFKVVRRIRGGEPVRYTINPQFPRVLEDRRAVGRVADQNLRQRAAPQTLRQTA